MKSLAQKPDLKSLTLPLPLWELVAMMAALLALNALAIDIMLPALDDISAYYNLADQNQRQDVVIVYVLGFGLPQLFFGPITDRFGRKKLLQFSLLGYAFMAFACMLTNSFQTLLVFRFLTGLFAAGTRVCAGAIIRDLTSGRTMAKIMSLVMTVFMIVPILAPAIGEGVMYFAPWQWTFGVLGVTSILLIIWSFFRLPETLPPENRIDLKPMTIIRNYKTVLKTPVAVGYMMASGIIFGSLFAFIASSEQVFSEVFDKKTTFVFWFALIALGLAIASLTNSRIVERYGMRRISHAALFVFILVSITNAILIWKFGPVFEVFLPLFMIGFACFGLIGANFSSIALEPMGKISGSANAVYGCATSTGASLIGGVIASHYNGSVVPMLFGFTLLGVLSLVVVTVTEKGRLFELGTAHR